MNEVARAKFLISNQAVVKNSNELVSLQAEYESHYDEPTLKQELDNLNKGVPIQKDIYDQESNEGITGDVPYNPDLVPEKATDFIEDDFLNDKIKVKKAGFEQFAGLAIFVAIIFLGLKYV